MGFEFRGKQAGQQQDLTYLKTEPDEKISLIPLLSNTSRIFVKIPFGEASLI